MKWIASLAALSLAFAACGSDTQMMDMPDLAEAPPDMVFATAPHLPFPEITQHSNPAFSSPQIVTITYQGDTRADQLEAFGDAVVGSQWLKDVGTEYGVTSLRHQAKVRLTTAAPSAITDAQIITFLQQQAQMGTLPAPSATNKQLIYIVYFPKTTKVTDSGGAVLCGANGAVGYHGHANLFNVTFGYAVIPDCGTFDDATSTSSHEIIEASTDTLDGWFLDPDFSDPWIGLWGSEDADLCQDQANVMEAGFAFQRSWSNAAAKLGGSPCVPQVPGEVYINVSPMAPQDTVLDVASGGSVDVVLPGWSTAPSKEWRLSTVVSDYSDFDPSPVFSSSLITNGGQVTVTLTADPSAASGKIGSVMIYSGNTGNFWPLTIRVK